MLSVTLQTLFKPVIVSIIITIFYVLIFCLVWGVFLLLIATIFFCCRCDLSPSSSNKRSVLELSLLQPEAVLLKSPSSASQSRKFSPCSPVIQNTAKGWESSSPGSRFPASSPLKPNLRVFQTSFSNKVSQDSTIHPDIAASRPHTYTSTSGFREKYSTQANMNGASHSSQVRMTCKLQHILPNACQVRMRLLCSDGNWEHIWILSGTDDTYFITRCLQVFETS